MPSYWVEVPFAGKLSFEIEADDEEAAIEAAMNIPVTSDFQGTKENPLADYEWETLESIVSGNVCYAPLREASAEPID